MRKSVLVAIAAFALGSWPDLAMAKHKQHPPQGCPIITHYFSWFTTYSNDCFDDLVDAQWVRRIRGEGNHDQPLSSPPPR